MKQLVTQNKHLLLLFSVFLLAEIFVNPIGEFPLNDDWSYSKSVRFLVIENHYTIGSWGAMTLFTHIIWGSLFAKLFGFSFMALKASTWVSALIGLTMLYKVVLLISDKKELAFIVCLTLLFNPVYFNLANTFMTDVNFITCFFVIVYFALLYFRDHKLHHFILVFVMSVFLVLIRQFGIIVPACFAFACFFNENKRWKYIILSLVGTAAVYLIFKGYETFLAKTLPPGATYKFSSKYNPFSASFWDLVLYCFSERYQALVVNSLVFTAPLLAFYLKGLVERTNKVVCALVLVLSFVLVYYCFGATKFPTGNIFSENMNVGPETFYQNWTNGPKHTASPLYLRILYWVKLIFSTTSISVLVLFLIVPSGQRPQASKTKPGAVFVISFTVAYVFLTLLSEFYFDRYHLPIFVALLILFAGFRKISFNHSWYAYPLLALSMYAAICGTKDYFSLNRCRWQGVRALNQTGVTTDNINAGFEVNCWNDGQPNWWYPIETLEGYDYLIQFDSVPGFKVFKELEFQRYYPYKKDKLNIFVRDSLNIKAQ